MKMKPLMMAAALAATIGLANATPILPGQSSVPVSPTVVNPLGVPANIIANSGVQPFNLSGGGDTLIGNAQEWVVKSNTSPGSFGTNQLSFILQVSLSSAPPNNLNAVIERITGAVFAGFMVNVEYFVQNGAQILPTNADRSANGSVLAFNFNVPNIMAGQQSVLLIINTNATSFAGGNFTIQDGLTANAVGFAPVPDGGSAVALLGVALVGLEFLRRKLATA